MTPLGYKYKIPERSARHGSELRLCSDRTPQNQLNFKIAPYVVLCVDDCECEPRRCCVVVRSFVATMVLPAVRSWDPPALCRIYFLDILFGPLFVRTT